MRVPTTTTATVQASNEYSSTQPNLQQPDLRPAQAIGEVSKDVNAMGAAIGGQIAEQEKLDAEAKRLAAAEEREARKAALAEAKAEEKRAREVMLADGVVDVQRRASDDEVKFKSQQQGLGAVKASGPALDGLDKHITDVGQRFSDPLLRAEFNVRAKQAVLGSRKSIEEHTSKEYNEGIKKTYSNLRDRAVRTAGSVELTPEEMKSTLAPVDQGADEFMSAEEAKAAKAELRGDVAAAVIERRATAGNVDEAEAQLKLDRALLGDKRAGHLQELIDSKRKDLGGKAAAVEVNVVADGVRDGNNIVMPVELKAAMPKVAANDPRREAYEAALEKQLTLEKKRMDELVDFEVNNASVAIDDGVPIPDRTIKRLRKYDNEKLRALLDKEEARRKSRRIEREGNASDKAEARREQARINSEAEEKFAAELYRNPHANHRDFILKFTRDVSAREGRPVTITPDFEAKLEADSEREKSEDGSAKSKAKASFTGNLESKIDGMTKPLKKGSREDQQLTKDWGGYGALRYQAEIDKNGGKPLTTEQERELAASIIHEAGVGPKKIVSKPPPSQLGPAYEPAAVRQKKIKAYGYSADKRTRIPVYEDDSTGEPEPVP